MICQLAPNLHDNLHYETSSNLFNPAWLGSVLTIHICVPVERYKCHKLIDNDREKHFKNIHIFDLISKCRVAGLAQFKKQSRIKVNREPIQFKGTLNCSVYSAEICIPIDTIVSMILHTNAVTFCLILDNLSIKLH